MWLAACYATNKNYPEAKILLESVLARDASNVVANVNMGLLLLSWARAEETPSKAALSTRDKVRMDQYVVCAALCSDSQ